MLSKHDLCKHITHIIIYYLPIARESAAAKVNKTNINNFKSLYYAIEDYYNNKLLSICVYKVLYFK